MPISFGDYMPELNVYATPAILTLVLLVAETGFLAYALPETRGKAPIKSRKGSPERTNEVHGNGNGNGAHHAAGAETEKKNSELDIARRLKTLSQLKVAHFAFLGLFSGVEFTLTFLTFDRESSRKATFR
jgi:hypothetical protein